MLFLHHVTAFCDVGPRHMSPSPTLSPTDPVPRGLLTLCPGPTDPVPALARSVSVCMYVCIIYI